MYVTVAKQNIIGQPKWVNYPIAFPNNFLFLSVSEDGAATGEIENISIDITRSDKSRVGLYPYYAGLALVLAIGY